jgi:hypothetical protein
MFFILSFGSSPLFVVPFVFEGGQAIRELWQDMQTDSTIVGYSGLSSNVDPL